MLQFLYDFFLFQVENFGIMMILWHVKGMTLCKKKKKNMTQEIFHLILQEPKGVIF